MTAGAGMPVVVVGAGVVGASVAYHLARRGVEVTLLDREPSPAAGVTGGSFAWIGGLGGDWPGGARDLRELVLADHRRLESELPDVVVRRSGSLTWGGDTEGPLGEGRFEVGPEAIRALEPRLRTPPERAVHTPSDRGVDPVPFTTALVRAACARGARAVFGATVTALRTVGGRVEGVLSSAGYHPASTVVLAAGTEVARLAEPLGVDLPVATSPACLVRLTAPPGLVRTVVACPGFEVREVRDGHVLMTVPVDGTAPERRALGHLRSAFTGADDCRVLECRVSARPMPAGGPLLGHVAPGVYVTVTHSAVTLAPTVGRLVAAEIATGEPAQELRRCRPRGLPPDSWTT
ncbi:NAD(P)/FAD-dependent oxidoreductase [Streptomyces bullii]|uniref:NAD(P)/FAD-dependent oxidoreductase n=1 Tax=Streptomyces bullii TaxID=349910 RepID=A0ABW0V0B1_9ACTN